MKTALESYMETITVQEKTKILTEQEYSELYEKLYMSTFLTKHPNNRTVFY